MSKPPLDCSELREKLDAATSDEEKTALRAELVALAGKESAHYELTLRDHFAGVALAAMIPMKMDTASLPEDAATAAYEYADAMLLERELPPVDEEPEPQEE